MSNFEAIFALGVIATIYVALAVMAVTILGLQAAAIILGLAALFIWGLYWVTKKATAPKGGIKQS